jgi:hypothetical protein
MNAIKRKKLDSAVVQTKQKALSVWKGHFLFANKKFSEITLLR